MNRRKHISKKLVCRLLLFVAVALSAVLFDAFHEGSVQLEAEHQTRSESHNLEAGHMFFFNPVNSFKLRTGVDKLLTGFIFAASQNQFLSQYHNYRAFHLFQAESLNERKPFLLTAHFMKFNFCHHSCPDDHSLAA
ncbi:MAG: hypothetical protein AB7U05_16175 [Mangrovibacterium sp.]